MSTRRIAYSSILQLMSQGVAMAIGIVGTKLVALSLAKELVGNYLTVYSYLQIFAILADFGLYAVAVRELAASRDRSRTFAHLFVLRMGITILSLGSAIAVAWVLPRFHGTPLPLGIALGAFTPFFILAAGMFRAVFQVEYRMGAMVLTDLLGKVIPVTLIALVYLSGVRESSSLPLYHLYLVFGGAGAISVLLIFLWFSRGLVPSFSALSGSELMRISRLAAPFGAAFLATTVYRQSDLTLIALLRPGDYEVQNAYYGVVMRIAEVGFLLPTFVLNSALPLLSSSASGATDRERHERACLLGVILLGLLALGSMVSLVTFFWARPLVLLLTGPQYLAGLGHPGADTGLMLMSFPLFLGMLVSFCFYVLLMERRSRPLLLATGIAAALSLGLNTMLIPPLGFLGAAVTSIIIHLLLALALTIITIRSSRMLLRFSQFARWGVFTLLFGLLLFLSRPLLFGPFATVAVGFSMIIVASLLLYILGILPKKIFHLRPDVSISISS